MSFKSLPNELGEKIAGLLSAKDLASFRLASKSAAELGYRPLRDSISDTISFSEHHHLTGNEFVTNIVSGLQTSFPKQTSEVTDLYIETYHFPHETLPDRCHRIALPRLAALHLTGVAITPMALRSLIINHQRTLRHLVIRDVALIVANKASMTTRYCAWLSVIAQIQRCTGLESIEMYSLTWRAQKPGHAVFDRMFVSMPHTKYHRRVVDANDPTGCYFRFFSDGLLAEGAVAEGLREFPAEIRKGMMEYFGLRV